MHACEVAEVIVILHQMRFPMSTCSGIIPRLSLTQQSLYVGMFEKLSPPTTHGGVVRKYGPEKPYDVVSREINLWKSFDLLLGSNL